MLSTQSNFRFQMTKILLFCAAFLVLTGCVGAPKLPDETDPTAIGQISDKKTAQQAWRDSQVRKYGEIWTRESNSGGDHFVAGQAAYNLAFSTSEPEWSKAAITSFEQALKTDLAFPERARAGLGAAHRLHARNYPIKGAAGFLFFGTPNMLRSSYVSKSVTNLNRAVEATPDDPIVRLYRASAFVGIPTLFGVRETGLADYDVLDQWTQQPENNSEYIEFLSSKEWRDEYFLTRAQSMEQAGEKNEATMAWRVLSTSADDPYLQALALQHLAN